MPSLSKGQPWGSQTAVPSLYCLSHVTSAAWVCSRMSVMCVQVGNTSVCGGQRSGVFSLGVMHFGVSHWLGLAGQ